MDKKVLYPPDGGLRPHVRNFEDTLSVFEVLAKHFGTKLKSKTNTLRS